MRKYVITGGPSVGKTTVIKILSAKGYKVVPESARMIIEEEKIKESDILPWKNPEKFQQKVAERQIELENKARGDLIFLDRGIIDGYAYCKYENVKIPSIILEMGAKRYDKVFLLESLDVYEKDEVRHRSLEEANKIHLLIKDAYEKFGYQLIVVPILPPEKRANFILKNI